jgi:hypothetical protein
VVLLSVWKAWPPGVAQQPGVVPHGSRRRPKAWPTRRGLRLSALGATATPLQVDVAAVVPDETRSQQQMCDDGCIQHGDAI